MSQRIHRDKSDSLLHADLISDMHYCPETGIFTRRHRAANMAPGTVCGTISSQGYVLIRSQRTGRRYQAHRLAWLYVHGEWPRDQIDHINGKRADNRICNLRDVTGHQNRMNKGMIRSNTSGFKGVYSFNGRWKAQIQFCKKSRFLGMFETKDEAHAAYEAASRELFGEFHRSLKVNTSLSLTRGSGEE